MATLNNDIKKCSKWIVMAFSEDKLSLNYTIDSFKIIDKFFDLHSNNGKAIERGRLASNLGSTLFSIGSYIGETLLKSVPGAKWVIDEDDSDAEINVAVKLPNGEIVWPVQRAIKRFKNGKEDSIFDYGTVLTKDYGTSIKNNKSRW